LQFYNRAAKLSKVTHTSDTQQNAPLLSIVKSALLRFGLNENEIAVYIEALRHDELSPFLAAKLTGIPRTTIYDVFMSLSLKGLIHVEQSSGFEKQQTRIKAENPSVLRKILADRRQESYDVESDITTFLPLLRHEYHKDRSNSVVEYFPGVEGLRKVYFDLEVAEQTFKESSAWTNLMPIDVLGNEAINKDVREISLMRKKIGVKTKYLVPLNDWTKHVLTYQSAIDPDYLATRDFRYIESPFFNCYLEIVISNNVMKMACADNDEVWGLVIRSRAFIETFRSIFMTQWQTAQPVTQGMIDSWGENAFLKEQRRKGQIAD
jgi:hypothetical protein